jgi:diaminohydroxyphosphoribosylaminopyrimidine deaminase/5-amino-6-(5-phosphoribosylamino)uracil reductase
VTPNERAAYDTQDLAFMRRALELAERGWGHVAPNPLVGAVVVQQGTIVGEGHHAAWGGPHAEVVALEQAGERARGATLYVTLEPCAHTGKTPPCTDAILAAGIRRVVAAVEDPNPTARGGAKKLRKAGLHVTLGALADDARELNVIYFHGAEFYRPFVTLKLALSREGTIADKARTPRWLTGADARREVHRLRAGHDAIGVGLGTAIADDPQLTVRDAPAPRRPPIRVVFSRGGKLPPDSRLVMTAREIPVFLLAVRIDPEQRATLTRAGVTVLEVRDFSDGLLELASRGVRSVLLEGGARITGAALRAGAVDRIVMFQTPVSLGPDGLHPFAFTPVELAVPGPKWKLLREQQLGADLMTVYAASGM